MRGVDLMLPEGFVRALTRSTSVDDVLDAVAEWVPDVVPAERSSISVVHDDDNLVIHARGGHIVLPGGTLMSRTTTLTGKAFTEARVQRVDDLTAPPTADLDLSRLVAGGLRSAMCAPVIVRGDCLATINVASPNRGEYLDEHERLLMTVADVVGWFLDTHARAERERRRAETDPLTGVLNRSAILEHLDRLMADPSRSPGVIYLDVNGFKRVNDRYGHAAGDALLHLVVDRLHLAAGPDAALGRLGGDEFLLVLDDPDADDLAQILDALAESHDQSVVIGDVQVQLGLAAGVAVRSTPETTTDALLGEADHAMYQAKRAGLPNLVVDDTLRAEVRSIATIDRDLDAAMRSGDLTYHLQGVYDLETGELCGGEALLRWNHPQLGWIPPPKIMDRVAATGAVAEFTRWSVECAAEMLVRLREHSPRFGDKAIGLNLSPPQLALEDYAGLHLEATSRWGLRPGDLIVEVVESNMIEDASAAHRTLQKLGEAGAVIGLDDFGVGDHNLSYFTMFPIHALKLDKSMVRRAANSEIAFHLMRGLSRLADDLGIVCLSEGIETVEDLRRCRRAGLTQGQGWYMSRAVPLEEFGELPDLDLPDLG